MVTNQQVNEFKGGTSIEICIDDCLACFEECTSCIKHCLSKGGKHVGAQHLTLLMECSDICQLSAKFMELKTQFSYELCQLCSSVCEACGDSCSSIDPEDREMVNCADVCRRCSQSCLDMAH